MFYNTGPLVTPQVSLMMIYILILIFSISDPRNGQARYAQEPAPERRKSQVFRAR
jgi:hypothetical protein